MAEATKKLSLRQWMQVIWRLPLLPLDLWAYWLSKHQMDEPEWWLKFGVSMVVILWGVTLTPEVISWYTPSWQPWTFWHSSGPAELLHKLLIELVEG